MIAVLPAVATKIYNNNNNKISLAFHELMRLSPSFVCFFFCFLFCCCFVFFFDPFVYGNSSLQAQLMIITSKPDCEFSSSSSCIIIFSSEEKDSQITYVVQILSFSFRDSHTNRLLDEGFLVLVLRQCFGLCKRRSAASEEAEEGEEEEIRRKRRRRPSRMDIRWSPLEHLAAFYQCRFELGLHRLPLLLLELDRHYCCCCGRIACMDSRAIAGQLMAKKLCIFFLDDQEEDPFIIIFFFFLILPLCLP